jgi:hypothetical protein
MCPNVETETNATSNETVQLAWSTLDEKADGDVTVHLHLEEANWAPVTGVRLTEDDVLELREMLGVAAEILSRRHPQRFARLVIVDPAAGIPVGDES